MLKMSLRDNYNGQSLEIAYMSTRNKDGTFVAGKSGNPAGRPKKEQTIGELITDHDVQRAVTVLNSIIKNVKAKDGDRINAIKLLFNRKEGTPTQTINQTTTIESIDLPVIETVPISTPLISADLDDIDE